jgi:small subunit ribosomal protein S19e
MKEAPIQKVILKLSEELKKNDSIKPPVWSNFVKTGVSQERPPSQPDWWFLRSAAILRKVSVNGPLGTQRLRVAYGDRRRRGHKQAHHKKAGGKIIRLMLQQLETAGLVKKVEKPTKGRMITPKGQKLLSKAASGL